MKLLVMLFTTTLFSGIKNLLHLHTNISVVAAMPLIMVRPNVILKSEFMDI